jgi:hypothetical protein
MTSKDLEVELQTLDPRLTVVPNPDRVGLSNIFFEGRNYDLPVVSTEDIREEPDAAHYYQFPNGLRSRFWTRSEIVGRVEDFLKKIETTRELYQDDK